MMVFLSFIEASLLVVNFFRLGLPRHKAHIPAVIPNRRIEAARRSCLLQSNDIDFFPHLAFLAVKTLQVCFVNR